MTDWLGYWEIEAPVMPEEQDADMALLIKINVPNGVNIKEMTVWVHGREWTWRRVDASTL